MLNQALAMLTGGFEVTITPAGTSRGDASNAEKLGYLAARDRDFLAVTPELEAAAAAAMSEALDALFAESLPLERAIPMLGEGVLEHIVGRFESTTDHGTTDVSMNPLRPSTIARKRHAKIGIDTGDLARSMADAQVTTRKI